jgi:hypothetical protein
MNDDGGGTGQLSPIRPAAGEVRSVIRHQLMRMVPAPLPWPADDAKTLVTIIRPSGSSILPPASRPQLPA